MSIIPFRYTNGIVLEPTPVSISSCTGDGITCYGQAKKEIQIPSPRHSFMWTFVIADVVFPLLGFDFLENFGHLIDCKVRQITDSIAERSVNFPLSPSFNNVLINQVQLSSDIDVLLSKYPYITSPHDNKDAAYCGVYHRIEIGSNPPVFAKPRQLSEEKFKAAQEGFCALQIWALLPHLKVNGVPLYT